MSEQETNTITSDVSLDQTEEVQQDETDFQMGYTIGVKKDGALFFQLHGTQRGTVELLGLCSLAEKQISTLVDMNLSRGHSQVIEGLNAIYAKLTEAARQQDEDSRG